MSFIDSKGAQFSFDLFIMKVFLNQYEFYPICRPSWLFFQYYRASRGGVSWSLIGWYAQAWNLMLK